MLRYSLVSVILILLGASCVKVPSWTLIEQSFLVTQRPVVPPEVSEEEFPHLDRYVFRTRILVETATVTLPLGDDSSRETTSITVSAVSRPHIEESLAVARELWKGANVDFDVRSITHINWQGRKYGHLWLDAERYPDYLTIIFLLPRRESVLTGMGSLPWVELPHGIVILNEYERSTLAHEIGHYLGLLHTFETQDGGDFVEDTPFHDQSYCSIDNDNLMSYCLTDAPILTPGQIERARLCLRYYRQDEIINPPPEPSIPLDIGDLLFGAPVEMNRYTVPEEPAEESLVP